MTVERPLSLESRVSAVETGLNSIQNDITEIKQSMAAMARSSRVSGNTIAAWAGVVLILVGMIGGAVAFALITPTNQRIESLWDANARLTQRIEAKFERMDTIDSDSLKERTKLLSDERERETQDRTHDVLIGVLWKKVTGDELPTPPIRNP